MQGALQSADGPRGTTYARMKWRYLIPYTLAVLADWIQGPYQYRVYESYNLTEGDIGTLYIVGFGSSFLVGTNVAALADLYGRKRVCVAYCIIYSVGCLTKNSPNWYGLLFGRFCGGVATSILFAVFEAWCVSECRERHSLGDSALQDLFGVATFANFLCAVVAALLGEFAVDITGSVITPFNMVPVILGLCALFIINNWEENYGDVRQSNVLVAGLRAVQKDPRLVPLGITGAMFEAAMYVFIFLWTPALETRCSKFHSHGFVFAIFMFWSMVGSYGYTLLGNSVHPEKLIGIVLVVAMVCMMVPVFVSSFYLVFFAFCAFELSIGLYWPCIMTLRSSILAEESRAAVTSIFRMPLNITVVLVLCNVSRMSEAAKFVLCTGFLGIGLLCQQRLSKLIFRGHNTKWERTSFTEVAPSSTGLASRHKRTAANNSYDDLPSVGAER